VFLQRSGNWQKGGAISRGAASGNTLHDLAGNGQRQLIVHVSESRPVTISWLHMMRRLSDAEFFTPRTTRLCLARFLAANGSGSSTGLSITFFPGQMNGWKAGPRR
jgi:hypothetical protein